MTKYKPFYRKVEQNEFGDFLVFKQKIEPFFNYQNFTYTAISKIYEQISFEEYKFLKIYCFNLLEKWVFYNKTYDISFINRLNFLIQTLKLKNELDIDEIAFMERLEGVNFSLNKKMKKITDHFNTIKGESTYFFYENAIMLWSYQYGKKEVNRKVYGNVILTNKQFGFDFGAGIFLYYWKDLLFLKIKKTQIELQFKHQKFNLEINELEDVYAAIDRLLRVFKYYI